jgi:hypothetical protein
VILLDEPFTGVDVTTENQIIELLKDLRAEGRVMLVSTHNLGSVPEFCDRVVLINRTVLAEGPTGEVFTQKTCRRPLAACCGTSCLADEDLHDDDDRRQVTVLTDDERPFVIYGEAERKARKSPSGERAPMSVAAGALLLRLHGQRHVGVGADRGNLRLPVVLPDAQGLVADRRCAVTLDRAGRSRRLHAGPALCSRRLSGRRAGRRGDAVSSAAHRLREDAIIGMIFVSFFALGLFMVSISPTPINVQTIVLGNVLAITPSDTLQLIIIGAVTLTVLTLIWKDLMLVFFDESHARTIGLRADLLKGVFFTLLSASTVAAMQTVGAFLVIALVVTPGATAYLLTDRFPRLICHCRSNRLDHLLHRRLSELSSSMARRAA